MHRRVASRRPFLRAGLSLIGIGLGARAASDDADRVDAALAARAFDSPDAVQGVAVDAEHAYAIGTRSIAKHDKRDGRLLARWRAVDEAGPRTGSSLVRHLNGGVVHRGELYCAHSDWPASPAINSVEVFDPATLARTRSIPVAGPPGALTWVDRHADAWWGAFARYDRVPSDIGRDRASSDDRSGDTRIARLGERFEARQTWSFPPALVERLRPMSNSGGSWGADGRLYLTGHDLGEAYVVRVPASGDALEWLDTIALPGVEGQGIAWDRSVARAVLYGIRRSTRSVIALRPGSR